MEKCRCKWCNLKNPIYVEYHDHEWGVPEHDDRNTAKRKESGTVTEKGQRIVKDVFCKNSVS